MKEGGGKGIEDAVEIPLNRFAEIHGLEKVTKLMVNKV